MKIAVFFTYDYSIEGLKKSGLFEREMKIYVELNKKYNIDFLFITYDEKTSLEESDFQNFQFISVYNFIKKSNNKLVRLLKSFIIPLKLSRSIKDVDVLHQHQLLGSWIPIIIKFILKKPLLIRTGYDAYLFSLLGKEKKYKILFYKYLTKLSLRLSDLYTVTSHSDFNFLSNKFKVKNVKTIPNWVESKNNLSKKRLNNKILMVGRLEDQKNYPLAFEFINKTKSSFEIDIYGTGSNQDYFEKTVLKDKLNINFLGNTSHEILINKYKNYNYSLTTSLFEGNPKTVLEALSNECIIFASKIPSHKELITEDFNGFLFEDINELLEKFELVINNKTKQNSIRKNCKKSIKNNDINEISKLMMEDYNSLMLLR